MFFACGCDKAIEKFHVTVEEGRADNELLLRLAEFGCKSCAVKLEDSKAQVEEVEKLSHADVLGTGNLLD